MNKASELPDIDAVTREIKETGDVLGAVTRATFRSGIMTRNNFILNKIRALEEHGVEAQDIVSIIKVTLEDVEENGAAGDDGDWESDYDQFGGGYAVATLMATKNADQT